MWKFLLNKNLIYCWIKSSYKPNYFGIKIKRVHVKMTLLLPTNLLEYVRKWDGLKNIKAVKQQEKKLGGNLPSEPILG